MSSSTGVDAGDLLLHVQHALSPRLQQATPTNKEATHPMSLHATLCRPLHPHILVATMQATVCAAAACALSPNSQCKSHCCRHPPVALCLHALLQHLVHLLLLRLVKQVDLWGPFSCKAALASQCDAAAALACCCCCANAWPRLQVGTHRASGGGRDKETRH